MAAFILLAVVLTIGAVLLVVVPLARGGRESQPAPKAALGAALVIVIGGVTGRGARLPRQICLRTWWRGLRASSSKIPTICRDG
jgi:hypothetical protein